MEFTEAQLGLMLALGTALFEASKSIAYKIALRQAPVPLVALSSAGGTALVLAPVVAWLGLPELDVWFWVALLVSGSLNIINYILYLKAIAGGDVSLVLPLMNFSPLVMLVTSPLITGEVPSIMGAMGMVLIVAGAYAMHVSATHKGLLAPFRAIWELPAARMMLAVAVLAAITSNFDKIGIEHSKGILWGVATSSFVSVFFLGLLIVRVQNPVQAAVKNWRQLAPIVVCQVLVVSTHMTALDWANTPYVISLKRTSALFAVLLGHWLLREGGFRKRLLGATLMVVGVVLIVLG